MNLLEMSFIASILIIVTMLLRSLFLNHLPKITFLALWGIILLRLLVPFSFDTAFSLNTFLLQHFPRAYSVLEIMSPDVGEREMDSQLSGNVQGISFVAEGDTDLQGAATANVLTPELGFQNIELVRNLESFLELVVINGFVVIWLVGAGLCAIFFILSYLHAYQKIRCAVPIENEFLNDWKEKQRLRRPLQILMSDRITTPLTIGIFKPKIILSKNINLQDEAKLAYILAHEFYHIKRFDGLWKLLAMGATCLHWFNPLVWIAFVLANRDLEITCDAWVVKQFGKHTKKTYAHTLISMVESQNEFSPFYSNFARHAVKERLESIMKGKKTTVFGMSMTILIVSVLTINAFAISVTDDGGTIENETEIEELPVYEWNPEAIYASLVEVNIGDITFKIGDFDLFGGSREQAFFAGTEDWLDRIRHSNDFLTAEEAAIIVASVFDEVFNVNIDGTLFDIFLRPHNLNIGEENNRVMWSGFIAVPDYLDDRNWMEYQLSHFKIFADTGEIEVVSYSREGRFYPSDWLD